MEEPIAQFLSLESTLPVAPVDTNYSAAGDTLRALKFSITVSSVKDRNRISKKYALAGRNR